MSGLFCAVLNMCRKRSNGACCTLAMCSDQRFTCRLGSPGKIILCTCSFKLFFFYSAGAAGKLRDSNSYVEEDHPTTDAAESITALQKSLEESQARCADLEGEVLQLREKMEGGQPSLSPGVESSRASLEETNTELSKRVGALEEERMVLEGRVGELMAELEEVRGEREKVVSAQEQRGRQLEAALQEKEQLNKGEWVAGCVRAHLIELTS